ncbi:TIR domain-containing protein [uncultured Bradyrhizobium sp.]|jgi:WD40 repeat protein|uniref:TIR domain-containing protein n=1 Tax=uncultured Bradyrhizobium sp. TaxID=199684 RepID=UPI0026287D2F|nr:TIR domain-containing protein [uncultured Bradyrhizobium sp.]
MDDNFKFDAFISHSVHDKPRARQIAERLRAEGMHVWFDEWIIRPGDDVDAEIEKGIKDTRVLVLCLSPNTLAADWVALERNTVLFRDPSNSGRRFVPVVLSPCDLPDTLRRYKYIDLQKNDVGFEQLLGACLKTDDHGSASPVLPEQYLDPRAARPLSVGQMHRLNVRQSWNCNVAIAPRGEWLAVRSSRAVEVWDIETGKHTHSLKGKGRGLRCIVVTRDGDHLIAGDNAGIIRVWNISGSLVRELEVPAHQINCICSLPAEGEFLVAAGDAVFHCNWRIEKVALLFSGYRLDGTTAPLSTLAVDAAGQRAIVGSVDGALHVVELKAGTPSFKLVGHSKPITAAQIIKRGTHAITGAGDKTIKVWNLETRSCIATLEGHQSTVNSIALSPDETLIVSSGSVDGTLRVWDWKSGACRHTIRMNPRHRPASVAFGSRNHRALIAAGTSHGPAYIFGLGDEAEAKSVPARELNRRYVNAKVVLIGESTVGKTTLAHRLVADKYVLTDSTHGMNVSRLDLPLSPDDTMEREALLWDLAGQEDYRLIHQLYLGDTALALLLINPQRDDPFEEAVDWLKALRSAISSTNGNREAVKLLVATRLDVGGPKVSQKKIERFLTDNAFASWISTSAKRGDNCSDSANGGQPSKLKQLIAQYIPWDKLPWTSTPRLLTEIKNAVVAMRDRTDIRLLRFAELAQRLEYALPGLSITEADIRTAVTLLANHGLVRPLKFGDLVLLQPDLLNGYAGAIIRAARMHKDEIGCVTEDAIYSGSFDFTGVERLRHRPDEELLLRALVQTLLDAALCIRETEDGKVLLIFPSQYRRDREIPDHPEIFVTYEFTGELQTIYTTLVVRLWYSQTFDQKELWQNAVEFTTTKGANAGILFDKLGEGKGRISVFFDGQVPEELKVVFIEYVYRHLNKYARDLQRHRQYVCSNPSCGEPIKDMDAVRKRKSAGKQFIVCVFCDEHVPLSDHIEERLGSDPIASQALAMDERARHELDTQALEQILTGHMQAICGEANQIFRELTKFDYGIDGEIEFKDDYGRASGKKIYVQLKSGASHLRHRSRDGKEIFDVSSPRHLVYWIGQPVDVYLVIRGEDDKIRWMNLTRYLKERKDKTSRQIVFDGDELNFESVWRVRDSLFLGRRTAANPRRK